MQIELDRNFIETMKKLLLKITMILMEYRDQSPFAGAKHFAPTDKPTNIVSTPGNT
jgi:hypothetical protein